MAQERADFLGADHLDIARTGEGHAHLRGINVELDRRAMPGKYIALEIRWDIEGEGVLPGVHAVIHFAQFDTLRRAEKRRLERINQACRKR